MKMLDRVPQVGCKHLLPSLPTYLGKKGGFKRLDSFLNPPNQIFLTCKCVENVFLAAKVIVNYNLWGSRE